MEETGVYWAAMILHPEHKARWIEMNCPGRKEGILADFRALFNKLYSEKAVAGTQDRPERSQVKKTKAP